MRFESAYHWISRRRACCPTSESAPSTMPCSRFSCISGLASSSTLPTDSEQNMASSSSSSSSAASKILPMNIAELVARKKRCAANRAIAVGSTPSGVDHSRSSAPAATWCGT